MTNLKKITILAGSALVLGACSLLPKTTNTMQPTPSSDVMMEKPSPTPSDSPAMMEKTKNEDLMMEPTSSPDAMMEKSVNDVKMEQ